MRKLTTEELVGRRQSAPKFTPDKEIYLVLDNIRSMHNVGAIFRTADGAGITRLFLCGITATPPRKEIEKTALGTTEHVKWQYTNNTLDIVMRLKSQGAYIIGLEQTDESILFDDFVYPSPTAIILGNEITGIDKNVLTMCDRTVEIPMRGIANSLNVATAAGIIAYQATRPNSIGSR
ncbi:MAG: tRNA (guanosine(18)-2'-O)-methyltransferase [bacterium ADurb.Bin400]|nr:MAG: tRNA (guanosine(18)-2'-O)-methyltransferase [bacterium ADurb.Bin400]